MKPDKIMNQTNQHTKHRQCFARCFQRRPGLRPAWNTEMQALTAES